MKKYWKTILISLVIVTTIGSYYIKAAVASKNDVPFKIETTSGNKEEIGNLILQASYQSGDIHRWLYISKDGSTNQMKQSFIEGLIARQVPLVSQKYFQKNIQKYRNFMRGKEFDPSLYFEDEARLIYTTFQDIDDRVVKGDFLTLQIDILDKNTNDSVSFEVNAPAQESYYWMYVNDVYVENGEIKILATGYLYNGGEELHIYTIDENNKEFEHDSIIAKTYSEVGVNSSMRIFNDYSNLQNENYFLYMIKKYKDQMGSATPEIISSQMYIYNNTNNEVEEISIPAELKPNMDSMHLHRTEIYIPVHSTNGLELNRYNIEKKQWEEPLHFNYPSTANDEEVPYLQITDSKIYFVNRVDDGHLFFIGDLRTGETLYEGKIIGENRENLDTDYSLNIQQIYSTN
ncbi:hypothetical protein AEA09_10400 [Lysinibacillus contaminans]|uniref:Uncharacterized protein n=1 Tax=Lysinibacillus contaminans TaxID=1293441 RepID=A0ABR5K1X0_9BACI|nr:hypothetical protein [Lysinibacillus contaminans]KOS68913.1 hypothetical protein AEA09_10400 [Lysinibacillus contaminans]